MPRCSGCRSISEQPASPRPSLDPAGAAVAAVGLARVGLPLFLRLAPADVPRLGDARVDGVTVLFTAAVSVAAALVCGLAPALRGAGPSMLALRDGGGTRGSTGRRR